MKEFNVHCAMCHVEALIKKEHVYMCCQCDEDMRIISISDIICHMEKYNLYL